MDGVARLWKTPVFCCFVVWCRMDVCVCVSLCMTLYDADTHTHTHTYTHSLYLSIYLSPPPHFSVPLPRPGKNASDVPRGNWELEGRVDGAWEPAFSSGLQLRLVNPTVRIFLHNIGTDMIMDRLFMASEAMELDGEDRLL